MEKVRARVFISGRVQGVLFRDSAARRARQLDVRGWIKNLADGRVEAVFEGQEDKVQAMIAWAKRGPILAKVENLEVTLEEYKGDLSDFDIKYD